MTWTESGASIPADPTHTVIPDALNVRESPNAGSARIGGVTGGREVTVVETQGEWSKIIYGTGYGWVQSKYLAPLGSTGSTEPQEPLAFTTQPQSGTAKTTEDYAFTWATNVTPDKVFLDIWYPDMNTWSSQNMTNDPASWVASYYDFFTVNNVSRYKIEAIKGSETVYSNEFTVTWTNDSKLPNPFVDVAESDPWYDAVLWAYYATPQVTNGMDDTHFGPTQTVTRGQCAAFLWRAMGEPEPTSTYNPFVDVPSWQYYYKPILWAVEKGITKGTDATHFSPDQTLSTAHIITFLYRAKNPGADGWYEGAASWAESGYGAGKPFGVSTPVNPDTNCPRGYVVMFLQKAK